MGKIKIFFFSLCLIPSETGDIWVLNSLIKVQKRLSPDIYKNLRVYWGAQTHIDEEINNRLVDLENAVLLLGEEAQNLKFQIYFFVLFCLILFIFYFLNFKIFNSYIRSCDWRITTFCVIPRNITNLNTPGRRLDGTCRAKWPESLL